MSDQINIDSPFPLIISTVDAFIVDSLNYPRQLLLGRKKKDLINRWRFIGGFADIDNFDDEQDVMREIKEETQINVNHVVYIGGCPIEDKRYKNTPHQVRTRIFAAEVDPLGEMKPCDDIDVLSWFPFNTSGRLENILIDEHKIVWNCIKRKLGEILIKSSAISEEEFAESFKLFDSEKPL